MAGPPDAKADPETDDKADALADAASRRIAIFVYEGVEPIDIGGTFGVFSMARRVVPRLGFFTVGESDSVIALSGGLRMIPDHSFASCPAADALIVCGGPGWSAERDKPAVIEFIKERARQALVASVCTGGLILAATDLLDGLPATTRRMAVGAEAEPPLRVLARQHPKVSPVEALLVDCGGVVTGGGVSLAIDLSLHLIGRLFGAAAAAESARIIEYEAAWQANKQRLPTIQGRSTAGQAGDGAAINGIGTT